MALFKIKRVGGEQAKQAAGLGLVKVDRATAKRAWESGMRIVIVGDKVGAHAFFKGWHLAHITASDKYNRDNFDVLANAFHAHLESELGRRPAFFLFTHDLQVARHRGAGVKSMGPIAGVGGARRRYTRAGRRPR